MSNGLIVIDKPFGLTSHGVVSRARRWLGTRKIGHAGTLDPMATGVLILGVNRATRLLGYLALHDKAYQATIRLGVTTVTDDAEGDIIKTEDASGLRADQVAEAMQAYVGDIWQRPSSVSAIKVDGKRAYARVRTGEDVELAMRQVNVARFELLATRTEGAFFDCDVAVECSSGTYVRALARDLGRDLGVGGHLIALRRTRIGGYGLEVSVTLGEPGDPPPTMISMADAARRSFPIFEVDEQQAREVSFGRQLDIEICSNPTGIIGQSGELLALYRPQSSGVARPVAVFN